MSTQYDVLVVGGGPTGSRLASQLARSGVSVAVFEKQPFLDAPVCCTGLVSEECLSRFGIDSSLVLGSFQSARVYSPAGKMLRLARPAPQAYALDRRGLNQRLAQQAQQAGAVYYFGQRVTALEVHPDRIVAATSNKQLTARAAVLATGYGSPLLAGLKPSKERTVGMQAEVASSVEEIEIHLGRRFAPGSFAWLVPLGGQRALAGLMAARHTKKRFENFLAYLESERKLSARGQTLARGITLHPPRRTYGARLLVVGDAAGQVKPLTGGGLYFGLLGADLAAECLSAALKEDDLSARRLSVYEKGWRAELGRESAPGRLGPAGL